MFSFVDFFFGGGMEEKGALAPHFLWPPLPNIQYRKGALLCFNLLLYSVVWRRGAPAQLVGSSFLGDFLRVHSHWPVGSHVTA